MHYYEVAPCRIFRTEAETFTYAANNTLSIGQLVVISVGKQHCPGIIIRKTTKPPYETKTIETVIEDTPIPLPLLKTALWLSTYYSTHFATVLQTILPRGLQTKRRDKKEAKEVVALRERTNFVLSTEQAAAIATIAEMTPGTALLHGVTGSGKTRVYIELAKRAIENHTSVIVLVPEIALTPQLVAEFSHHFPDILLAHSKQTEATRHAIWRRALTSTTPQVVVGARSALFLPLASIGLIIIDEAHEPSFKQEKSPRYSALRTASILATNHQAKLILGSATPTITDYYIASQSHRPIITMSNRAKKDTTPPKVQLVDMTKKNSFKSHRFLSDIFLKTVEDTLRRGEQVLVFHNRRGSAPITLCESCGWSAACTRCFTPLTLHGDTHVLQCHICGAKEKVPTSCPDCQEADIVHKGIGTKLIEAELSKLFPNYRIGRFDGDSNQKETIDKQYKDIYNGKVDIIIGTQVVAKGLDLPHLRTVGIIQADTGLALPDFNASERTFQLIAQTVGRVGRSHHPTTVIVQSYQPSHPAITMGVAQDYQRFYATTLKERRKAQLPPFFHLLKLNCIYKTEAAAIKNSQKLSQELRETLPKTVSILGPAPSFYERQHGTYRWQITLKSTRRAELVEALQHIPKTYWQAELDPVSLL